MITAKIIADSVNPNGKRITTFELEYPRFIHAEVMTHRDFSRNAQSSRAVPIDRTIELVQNSPAMPIYWGANKAGMAASEEVKDIEAAKSAWVSAAQDAVKNAQRLQALGLHKQIVNRVLEPFQNIRVILTGTEFNNFEWLRIDSAAQPEIQLLALKMKKERSESKPVQMNWDHWHTPYVSNHFAFGDKQVFFSEGLQVSLQEALDISASCCAQVSYRKLDTSPEKAKDISRRLKESDRKHASPFEHQAVASEVDNHNCNLKGWVSARMHIPDHTIWG